MFLYPDDSLLEGRREEKVVDANITNGRIRIMSCSRTSRCGTENLGRRRNTSEALDLIESLIKCTPAPITRPFYDSQFGKLSEIVPD